MSLAPPDKVLETTDGTTCPSEGIPDLSISCLVRQAVSLGCAGPMRICVAKPNKGKAGVDGQTFRGYRSVRCHAMVGGTGEGTPGEGRISPVR